MVLNKNSKLKKYVLCEYTLKLLCGTLQKTTCTPKVSTVIKRVIIIVLLKEILLKVLLIEK